MTSRQEQHSTNFRTKGVALTVLLAVAIFFLGQVAAALVLLLLEPDFIRSPDSVSPWQNLVAFSALALVVAGLLSLVLNKHHRGSVRTTLRQLGVRRLKLKHLGSIAVLQFLYIISSASILLLLEWQDYVQLDGDQSIGFDRALQGASLIPAFLTLVVLAPLIEELLFRGFLYQRLSKLTGVVSAAAVTSILFGLAHIRGADWQVLVAMDTALLSVFMIIALERTKTLLAPIIMHAIKNALAFYVLFLA